MKPFLIYSILFRKREKKKRLNKKEEKKKIKREQKGIKRPVNFGV